MLLFAAGNVTDVVIGCMRHILLLAAGNVLHQAQWLLGIGEGLRQSDIDRSTRGQTADHANIQDKLLQGEY